MFKLNDLKVSLTYIGAIVGAGFASGQELIKFFGVFQENGLWGTLIAGIIFSFLGSLVIIVVNQLKHRNYGELIKALIPIRACKTIDALIALSLWAGLGVMLVGSAALLNTTLNITVAMGFFITMILIYLVLSFGSKGLMNANTLLVPFLLVIAIGSCIMYIYKPAPCFSDGIIYENLIPNWWVGSLLYVAYNMVLAIVVMASIGETHEKMSPLSGMLGGAILGLLAYIMVKGMLLLPTSSIASEMPMLYLTSSINKYVGVTYSIGLWVALFTTALANAHALTKRVVVHTKKAYHKCLLVIMISNLIFIPWSFSTLIGTVYPILGYLGIPLVIALVLIIPKVFRKKEC